MTLVILAALTAALLGVGVVISATAVLSPRASLESELGRARRGADQGHDRVTALAGRFGGWVSVPATDLAILGWSREYWYRRQLAFAFGGMIVGGLIAVALRLVIVYPVLAAIPVLGLLVAGIGVVVASSDRATRADTEREEMRLALSYFLEVASIMLAGGAGAETALELAANRGQGRAFRRFARQVGRAKDDPRLNAFVALRDLGEEVGLRELVEFGDVMILSSENSATVRQALQDKASLLIFREQERRKAAALARNVTMSIPVAGIAGGFIIWLVYPAIIGLTSF